MTSNPQQSRRAEEAKRNPPDDSTHTKTPKREEIGSEREEIDLATPDTTIKVAEEGGNPVARLIRRLRGR